MLFSREELDSGDSGKAGAEALALLGDGSCLSMQSLDALREGIDNLSKGEYLQFVSRGQWSMHELLEELLRKAGPSQVFLSTWTVTEDPVRSLFMLKKEGLIKSLSCVLDYRITDRKPKPFQLLKQTADRIALTQCHAKTLVIRGEEWDFACVGSANFSRNPRIEAGAIFEGTQAAKFHQDWIEAELE